MRQILFGIMIISIMLPACSWLNNGRQVKVTDQKTGTSITISEDDVKIEGTLEFDGTTVEIGDKPEETPDI